MKKPNMHPGGRLLARCVFVLLFVAAACRPAGPADDPAPTQASQPGATAEAGAPDPDPTPAPQATDAADPEDSTQPPDYAYILAQALADCAAVGVNEVCYAHGQVAAHAQPGAAVPALAQPGDTADLAAVQGLNLGAGTALDAWGVAVLRLQADMPEGESLMVLAMGPAQLTDIDTVLEDEAFAFDMAAADAADSAELPEAGLIEPLQSFNFVSQPNGDGAAAAPSGLLLWTPFESGVAALEVNGATLVLGSTGFVQAEPEGELTVAMLEGEALVGAEGEEGAVPAGLQLGVELDADGRPSDPPGQVEPWDPRAQALADALAQYVVEPTDPRAEAIAQAVAQYGEPRDPRADILAEAVRAYSRMVGRYLLQKFNRVVAACANPANPQPRYVYNTLYWYNIIARAAEDDPGVRDALGANWQARLAETAARCLSFELDFDSVAEVTAEGVSFKLHLRTDALRVQFGPDGALQTPDSQPLKHLLYETTATIPQCTRELVAEDGTLSVTQGALKINVNDLRLYLDLWPNVPLEQAKFTCPYSQPSLAQGWLPLFYYAHEEMVVENAGTGAAFRIADWHTVEGELFAEAIFERSLPMGKATVTMTTFMVLVHTPKP